MRSLTIFTIIGLLFVFNISLAETIPAADVLITGACPDGTTMPIDVFGDLLGTIPAGPPGSNNAYVGMTYANMEIIQNVNIYPNTVPSQFLRINPVNGVVNATINFPFNGYVMGITFDGTHLWVVQWSPSNTIHQIALDGTLINSYPSPTGSYSARTIAYDPGSTNFWIGANLSSGVTELWKVDNTMTPIASTNTGSVVGWYMGGDWNGSAPTGSNLIVVDNVDNSIKQLDISGTTVTLVDQFACPEAYG